MDLQHITHFYKTVDEIGASSFTQRRINIYLQCVGLHLSGAAALISSPVGPVKM